MHLAWETGLRLHPVRRPVEDKATGVFQIEVELHSGDESNPSWFGAAES